MKNSSFSIGTYSFLANVSHRRWKHLLWIIIQFIWCTVFHHLFASIHLQFTRWLRNNATFLKKQGIYKKETELRAICHCLSNLIKFNLGTLRFAYRSVLPQISNLKFIVCDKIATVQVRSEIIGLISLEYFKRIIEGNMWIYVFSTKKTFLCTIYVD